MGQALAVLGEQACPLERRLDGQEPRLPSWQVPGCTISTTKRDEEMS